MSQHTVAVIGDSQSDWNAGYGVDGFLMWPKVLERALVAAGCNVRCRGFGNSGETTTQMLARADVLQHYDTPDVAIIYGGVNDPGNSIVQATTQANIQAMIQSAKYGAVGAGLNTGVSVANPAALPIGGELGQRYVVIADNDTTGGAAAWHPSHTATITGSVAASGMATWENRGALAGVAGWGRVAVSSTPPTKVARILVVSTNYLNFTTNGDTIATPYAAYASVRTAQQAAVTAENVTVGGVATVVYADLYGFQKARIQAGTDPNFASLGTYTQATSWHVCDYPTNNSAAQHHDTYGQQLVAQAAYQAMPAAWLTALV